MLHSCHGSGWVLRKQNPLPRKSGESEDSPLDGVGDIIRLSYKLAWRRILRKNWGVERWREKATTKTPREVKCFQYVFYVCYIDWLFLKNTKNPIICYRTIESRNRLELTFCHILNGWQVRSKETNFTCQFGGTKAVNASFPEGWRNGQRWFYLYGI